MKILYIITQADGGGAQKYTLAMAKHFAGIIAAGNEASKLFIEARKAGVKSVELRYLKRNINPFFDLFALFEIVSLIREERPDIVHLNSSKAGFIGSLAKPFVSSKIVFTAHGFIFNEPLSPAGKIFYLGLEKLASFFRDYIIAVSENDKTSALENNLINKDKISVIHNGIGQIQFLDKHSARQFLGLDQHKIVIGTLSNFYKTKGLDVLIDAIALLDKHLLQKIEVTLPGNGPEYENLKFKIQNLKLETVIKLHNKIEGPQYLSAFDVFAMPSRKEGLPFALLEAMQAGLPIVASSVGGIPEALGDAGLLVKPEDPKALARILQKMIEDLNTHGPNYFAELSQKAKTQVSNFSQEKMFEQTEAIYKKLLH